MNFLLERVAPPDGEPVTLEEMKRQLRTFSSDTDEDDDINALITAGREWVEDYTGRAILEQQWRLTIDSAPMVFASDSVVSAPSGTQSGQCDYSQQGLLLRRAPIMSIVSFASVDGSNVETAVPVGQYTLGEKDSKWPRVVPMSGANWSVGKYRIVFKAGFADEDTIPIRFKQAIKLWVEANYDKDEKMMVKLLDAAERIIKPERSDLQLA